MPLSRRGFNRWISGRNEILSRQRFVPDVPVACAIFWHRLSGLCSYTRQRVPLLIPV